MSKIKASTSKEPVLLSNELEAGGGFMCKERLKTFNDKALLLTSNPEEIKTDEDKLFITDYLANVLEAKIADLKLDLQVNQRVNQGFNIPQNSSSAIGSEGFLVGPAQIIKLNDVALKADKFEGKKIEARAWIDGYERMAKANDWTESTMIKYMPSFMTKSATDWFITMCQPNIRPSTSWKLIRTYFIKHYLGEQEHLFHRRRLQNSFQGSNETISSFLPRTLVLFNMAYPDNQIGEQEKVEQIIEKLCPEYQEKLSLFRPDTLMDLNQACLRIEQGMRASKAASKRQEIRKKNIKKVNNRTEIKPKEKNNLKCFRCDRIGHEAEKCFSSSKEDGTKLDPKTGAAKPQKKMVYKKEEKSFHKNQAGAVSKEFEQTKPQPVVEVRKILNINSNADTLIKYPINLNNLERIAMLDSGAHLSVIEYDLVRQESWKILPTDTKITGANNKSINILGKTELKLEMKIDKIVKRAEVSFVVVKNLVADVILGMDVLSLFQVEMNMSTKKVKFADMEQDDKERENKVLKSSQESILPPRSLTIVSATTDKVGLVISKPYSFSPTILGAHSVSEVEKGKVQMLLANIDAHAVRLKADTILSSLEQLKFDTEPCTGNEYLLSAIRQLGVTNEVVNVGTNLSNQQLIELDQLLEMYVKAFSINGKIGSTNILSHKIELTNDARPFKEPHRRRPRHHVEEAKKQVKLMLKEGIIEDSNSPFASAYLLVKKKNGETRMCIDFRRLNAMTKKSSYPLPNIDECLENLSGKRYFSNLDLSSGFWQIPVEKGSRELTAFRTEEGLFQFKKMPFGLCNAPASFQKMVNVLFNGLKGLHMQVFVDDICLASDSWEEHLKILAKVFDLLITSNLTLKANKCTFGASEVLFLGHILSADGIRQDPEKLKAITQLRDTSNIDELRRVLGMIGYYRRFVPGFAVLSSPLTKLLCKNVSFKWETEQKEALSKLIESLAKNATLKHFCYGKPTILKTDASKQGVGAILQQRDEDGNWKLVVCCSKKLTPAQMNYGVSELEALAIIYAVTKLRPYLLGHHFTILTDHCALCSLNLKEPKSERLKRWALILSSFNFTIKYIKGGLHRDVDCLSRAPLEEEPDEFVHSYALNINANHIKNIAIIASPQNAEKWCEELETDPESGEFFQLATQNGRGGCSSEQLTQNFAVFL